MFPDRAAELVFRELPVPVRPGERLTTQTQGKDNGRLETRSLTSTTALSDDERWLDVVQMIRRIWRRRNLRTGRLEAEVTYGQNRCAGP